MIQMIEPVEKRILRIEIQIRVKSEAPKALLRQSNQITETMYFIYNLPYLTPLPLFLLFPLGYLFLLLPPLPLPHQLKNPQIQRNPLPQPRRPLRMIPLLLLIRRIRMNQDTQRPPMDNQPGDERAELRRCEEVHLEHGDGVWADGLVEEGVDA